MPADVSTLTDQEKASLGIKARNDAKAELIKRHADEFQELVERNRVELGLPRKPQGDGPEQIAEKLRKAEERAERLRQELEAYRR